MKYDDIQIGMRIRVKHEVGKVVSKSTGQVQPDNRPTDNAVRKP